MHRILPVLLLLLAVVVAPSKTHAHAVLLETHPADNAVLESSPSEIALRFNEPVQPIDVRLVDSNGQAATTAASVYMLDDELRVALRQSLSPGVYILSYRVTSIDSHPVAGSIVFGIGPGADPYAVAARVQAPNPIWNQAAILIGALFLAAVALAGGAALWAVLIRALDPASRRLARLAAWLGALSAGLSIGIRGGLLAGGDATLLSADLWQLGLSTRFAVSMALAVMGFVLLALCLGRDGRTADRLAALGALIVLAGFPLSGHAGAAEPRWLTQPAVLIHAAAMTFWLGAFLPLLMVLNGNPPTAYRTVVAFSRRAMAAVFLLVVTGLTLAIIQVGGWAGLVKTDYGWTLLAKLTLVSGLVATAAWNKLRLTPDLLSHPQRGRQRLRQTIRIEIGLAALVLAVTSALGITPPPRSLTDGPAKHIHDTLPARSGYTIALPDRRFTALIELAPARAGRNRLEITLLDPDGKPFSPLELDLEIADEARGIEAIRRKPNAVSPGRYIVEGSEFALPGTWSLGLDVLITDFEKVSRRTTLAVQ